MLTGRSFSFPWQLALVPLAACSLRMQPKEVPKPDPTQPPLKKAAPRPVYRWAHLDTLVLEGGRVLQLYPAPPSVYERLPAPEWLPTAATAEAEEADLDVVAEERRRLQGAGPRVRRSGRTLLLQPAKGVPLRLVDNPAEDYEVNIAYEYVAALPNIKQWLVSVHLYEGGYYMLVNQQTGRRTRVWSPPAVAPDGRHFVCGNSDVLARYEPSGLQVWEVEGTSLRLLWQRQTEWGLSQPRWLDNRTILFNQDYFDKGDVDTRVMRLAVVP
ncbi:hypothetical protein FY528_16385 [Hymenobacter lutimineralis]|uniref:Uncharacterized protein n=1 Tax=Hymenobacter lutimineralis TaxID=2606448 RepID=A0A5D6UUB0_9BACT|nr:hypothetical protein [Hymenobacter lutimineralis]TYZ07083.1 hypothetical protein FY528_16385 [Hymenobacter lutimineralis]